ncbi:hypothetical protein BDY19DRAFT_915820 [Irpex rosettiformis]|uniref:Uncharacterized protein n=1 Tax=Irpex rosettiformis TaxID=378272 RepID=A0ACB8UKX8_9APHY|nr:hypothetical protein BDY19DRAFT_915820 [Irpex rosettiformis]
MLLMLLMLLDHATHATHTHIIHFNWPPLSSPMTILPRPQQANHPLTTHETCLTGFSASIRRDYSLVENCGHVPCINVHQRLQWLLSSHPPSRNGDGDKEE